MKPKPRVLLTTTSYRLVQDGGNWTRIERDDGRDRMGARRWADIPPEENSSLLELVVDQIGDGGIGLDTAFRRNLDAPSLSTISTATTTRMMTMSRRQRL